MLEVPRPLVAGLSDSVATDVVFGQADRFGERGNPATQGAAEQSDRSVQRQRREFFFSASRVRVMNKWAKATRVMW